MKPGTRYAVAVIADEHCFGDPETFTDEPSDSTGGDSLSRIKCLLSQSPVNELKSGTRTQAFATTVRIDGEQPLNVARIGLEQYERLAILPRHKDDALGKETGDGVSVFNGLVEDDGNRATTKPLIIEDAPSSSPCAGTPESKSGMTTVAVYKTEIERVTRMRKVPNPNYKLPFEAYGSFGSEDITTRGGSMRGFSGNFGAEAFAESKTVFGEEKVIEVDTVTTTGNRGMAGAFQFRIVVEKSAD